MTTGSKLEQLTVDALTATLDADGAEYLAKQRHNADGELYALLGRRRNPVGNGMTDAEMRACRATSITGESYPDGYSEKFQILSTQRTRDMIRKAEENWTQDPKALKDVRVIRVLNAAEEPETDIEAGSNVYVVWPDASCCVVLSVYPAKAATITGLGLRIVNAALNARVGFQISAHDRTHVFVKREAAVREATRRMEGLISQLTARLEDLKS